MHVLLTGATGALGQALVARLDAEGHRVSCLTRRPYRCAALFGRRLDWYEWHPFSEAVPDEALRGVEAIVHLAGEPLVPQRVAGHAERYAASRVAMAKALAEAVRGRGIRLVGVSAAVAASGSGEPVSETAAGDGNGSAAIQLLRRFEDELLAAGGEGGSVAVVRLGLVAATSGPLAALVALARRGLVPRLKGNVIAAIALEDAVAMLAGLASERGLSGIIHGVAPQPMRGENLAGMLRAVAPLGLSIPMSRRGTVRRLGAVTAAMLEARRRVLPERLLAAGALFGAPDPTQSIAKAIAEAVAGTDDGGTETPVEAPGAVAPTEALTG
ncbi:MAG: NAD-dependent epimerase/dehydratase family protein [Proteobacteria bacterium]|nr:NAD-dependent epimerase/dehydratase family protein [Pseudomonadota bacterium]